jgi:hypothetical protein
MKVFSTIALILLFSAAAYGCDCQFGGGAVCQDYWKASAVFVGTVIEGKTVMVKRGEREEQQRLVRFSIDEPFRGAEGAQVEVMTGMGDSDCGIGFRQAQQYLVYATFFEGKLYTGICMRTKAISAAAADLEYMRGLTAAKTGGVVYGEVTAYSRDEKRERISRPLAGAKITIEGPGKKEIITDKKGAYRVDGLPAGDYTVTISPPQGLSTGQTERKINLADGGCSVVSFWLENDGGISGRVLNPQGLPINNAELFLLEADKERYQGHWDAAYSDESGRYTFKRIPAGRYVLLIRFDGMTSQSRPFPTTYYPGVTNKSQARLFTIGDGQQLDPFDLEVPPLPLEHEVVGVVLWANGQPATNASVGYGGGIDPISYGVKVDDQGRFSFKAYDGMKLGISASVQPERGKYLRSNNVEVVVSAGLPQINLIIPNP